MEEKGGEDDTWLRLGWKEPKPLLEEYQGRDPKRKKGKSEDKGRDPKEEENLCFFLQTRLEGLNEEKI